MDVVFLIGRILFAVMFVNSGINHWRYRANMVPYAQAMGAPSPEVTVPLTGAMIGVGAVLIALGLWADLGALLIAIFLLAITPIMHPFWKDTEPQARQMQQINFFKNLSLLGAALVFLYLYDVAGDAIDISITGPLFLG